MFRFIADITRLAIVSPRQPHHFCIIEVESLSPGRVRTTAKSSIRDDRVFNWEIPHDMTDVQAYWQEYEEIGK